MSQKGRFGPLVGSIDEGTSSTRFLVFAAKNAEVITYHQLEVTQITPQEGWVEQDPLEILHKTKECIKQTVENLKKLDISPSDIVATGITNQRETTILWDSQTGQPLYNALVWLDVRTADTVNDLLDRVRGRNPECIKHLCGLPISTYFSASKIKWLMDNVDAVRSAIKNRRCFFGTVDTWLIWNLTGGVNGGVHVTDVTNASRTMLMNIKTLAWDPYLCKFFDIPMEMLPKIKSSSEIYGYLSGVSLDSVPVSGCLGDQQSALVGQLCLKQGQAKNTYGTGCFLLYNTGPSLVMSKNGLLTTVAYKMGPNARATYALEGSIAIAGVALKWMRDNLGILRDVAESQELAEEAGPVGHVIFVPAFSGLYAPYWRQDARSVIWGLTEETSKKHLIRAALESVCFQTRDILEAMHSDCGITLTKLLVDGGMTRNDYLMQKQADLCGIPVVRPHMTETTALGAAIAAGSAKGVDVWDINNVHPVPCDTFKPNIAEDLRDLKYSRWKLTIQKSLGWDLDHPPKSALGNKDPFRFGGSGDDGDVSEAILRSLPAAVFFFSSFLILLISKKRF